MAMARQFCFRFLNFKINDVSFIDVKIKSNVNLLNWQNR